jgi:hypothetical protein
MPTHDSSILEAALIGYQAEHDRIEQAIADLRRRLRTMGGGAGSSPAPKKRRFSAAAKMRMAAAQRKRWREFKKQRKART